MGGLPLPGKGKRIAQDQVDEKQMFFVSTVRPQEALNIFNRRFFVISHHRNKRKRSIMVSQLINTILTSNVISVPPETFLEDAVSVMEGNKISCLVVLRDKQPVGIFTERDFVFLASQGRSYHGVVVEEVMSNSVVTAETGIDLYEAYRLLEANQIRHLVIVDHNGEIAGVVTQTDIINNLGLEYFLELKNISKIMTKNVVTLPQEAFVREALAVMASHSISCVVVQEEGCPVGMLTESDAVRLFRKGVDMASLQIKEVMSHPVHTISPDLTVHEAAIIMDRKDVRRLVVTDGDQRILGLVTQYDVIKNLELRYIDFLKEIIRGKEKKLEETERDLNEKIVLDNILRYSTEMAIVATDLDGRIVYYNPSAEKIFGHKAEAVIGEWVHNIHVGEDVEADRLRKALSSVQEQGEYQYVLKLRRDGGIRLVGSTISGIRDKENKLLGYVLLGRDITKRIEEEEEAQRNYDRQTVLNQLLSLALENISLEDILMRALNQILSLPWCSFESKGVIFLVEENQDVLTLKVQKDLPRDLQEKCAAITIGRCICGQTAQEKKLMFVGCVDTRHEIRYEGMEPHGHYCVPILFAGNLLGIINIYVKEGHQRSLEEEEFLASVANTLAGVIARKRAEESLVKVNTQLQTLIQAIPDVVFFKDAQLRHIIVNRAGEELLGLKQTELAGKTVSEVLPPEGSAICGMSDEEVLRDLKTVHIEEEFIGKDGEKIFLDTIKVPLQNEQGKAIGLVGVCRDISERKRMEEELLRAKNLESVGILAGGIAHDFNNMLTAIIGNITLAKKYAILNKEAVAAALERAEHAANHAGELTKLLITFSKGGMPVKKVVCLTDLIKASFSGAAHGANISCECVLPDDLWPVDADKGQLKWVFNNVLLNAQEAMPLGGTIKVRAQNVRGAEKEGEALSVGAGRYVQVSVEDTGLGIPKENLAKIFDPYFTTKAMGVQKGMGLGLSICYSIMKSHGGKISVESELGVGTKVTVCLPVSQAIAESQEDKKLCKGCHPAFNSGQEPTLSLSSGK